MHLNSNICLIFLILIIVPLPSSLTQEDSHNSESMISFAGKKLVLEQGIFVYGGHNWKETIRHHFIAESSKVFQSTFGPEVLANKFFSPACTAFCCQQFCGTFCSPAHILFMYVLFDEMAKVCILEKATNVSATWFHEAIQLFLIFSCNNEQLSVHRG